MIGKLKQTFDGLKRDGSDDQACTCDLCMGPLNCDHENIVIDVRNMIAVKKNGNFPRTCADCGGTTGGIDATKVPIEKAGEDGKVPLELCEVEQ